MPLEHHTHGRAVPRRRWYRPTREPLPPEPGRLVVSALLQRARRARGCVTPGDDRLETRVYAVKRYLFRLGHAARSARYGTSVEQLVVGLAPMMGWGDAPQMAAERARWVRAHRKSVQRWLDDLEVAAMVDHEPERDEHGLWWRTQIVLLKAPAPLDADLATAARRARGWRGREQRRGRSLARVRRRSATPSRRVRVRLARERAGALHEGRRRAAVERAINRSSVQRALLTHPFGAPPRAAQLEAAAKPPDGYATADSSGSSMVRSESTEANTSTLAAQTDACALRDAGKRRDQEQERLALIRRHAVRRIAEVESWPSGRRCPAARLREAWVAHRHGLDWVTQSGAALAGPVSTTTARRLRFAIALYEAYAVERPPDWPTSGPAVLLGFAAERRADVFAGDVARLLIVAKQMRAAALERDEQRLRRQARRALRRSATPPAPIEFRTAATRWESPEQRRQRARDLVLLRGDDPARWPNASFALDRHATSPALTAPDPHEELDGVGARAARYRNALRRGIHRLVVRTNRSDPS